MGISKPNLLWLKLLVLLTCACASTAFAQPKTLRFEHIGTNAGLSQSNVICILQDSRGFMWFGTRDGLNKYDGYNITVYRGNADDSSTLTNNTVNDIKEDAQGNLWIATWNGLSYFDRQKERFTRYRHDPRNKNSIGGNLINTVFVDREGALWIGLEGQGLDRLDPATGKFEHFMPGFGAFNGPIIKRIIQDKEGILWLANFSGGLTRLDPVNRKFKSYLHDPSDPTSISHNDVWGLFEDRKGRIWAGTMGGGLNRFDKEEERFFRYEGRRSNGVTLPKHVMAIQQDYLGNIWIGAENGPLNVLTESGEEWRSYPQDLSDNTTINNHSIWSICRDNKGNMWVGTFSGGINFFNRETDKFRHYQTNSSPTSLSNNNVLAILEDSRNTIWIGTDGGGLNRFDPGSGTFHQFRHQPGNANSLSGDHILSLAEGHDKKIWIGTWGSGVTVFDPVKNVYRHHRHDPNNKNTLSSNNAWCIYRDRDGTIWVGTYSAGVDRYDPVTDSFTHYAAGGKDDISHNMINLIYEDSKGRMWIGTNGGGLNCLENKNEKKFVKYRHSDRLNSISNDIIFSISEDDAGNFWIGTATGLNYLNPVSGLFENFYKKDGLPNESVFSITEDKNGNLWLGTNRGVSRFNVKERRFENFTVADGLQALEFKQAAWQASNGRIYLGGINGLNEFHPDSVGEVEFVPNLVLTAFHLFNKPVQVAGHSDVTSPLQEHINETKKIRLSYDQSVISFEFASLNYTASEHKKYSIMLEGFDKDWNDIGEKRTATYTNLNPGKYTFRVKGKDNAGNWSPRTIELQLEISPPFWKTLWFKIICGALVTGMFVTLYRVRVGMINQQKIQLEKLVKERTEELTTSTINERNARREAEKARQDAEQANRAKSVFLATMSHEIRTPMNGVIGMASLLNETSLSTEQREYSDAIRNCGENLLGVINDILDFSKIESGKMELEQKDFDLRACIEEVFEIFASPASAADIDLIYQLDYNVPTQVIGDGLRLRQILINLLGNAVKFTTKGEIFLHVRVVHTDAGKATLEFILKDTGIGIPPDKLERLFKPFSQVDSSTTRKYGGTGLGLAICEKLVSLMNGQIHVASTPGIGTTFTFTIQTAISVVALKTYVSFASNGVEGKVILVVDDNATNRRIVKAHLEQWKFSPAVVSSAKEALELVTRKIFFDLVITDMHMPEMDGVEFTRSLKKHRPNVPVILLSSVGDERRPEFSSMFAAVLSKPAKLSQLYDHIVYALKEISHAPLQTPKESKLPSDLSLRYPLKVMIADDNPVNQKLTERIFVKMGYTPVIVANGIQVLEAIDAGFDLIMMDVQMPEMDGLEATRSIRSKGKTQPVIVAMTANAMDSDREQCMNAGMDDYLSKPIQLEQMVQIIEKWAIKISARS